MAAWRVLLAQVALYPLWDPKFATSEAVTETLNRAEWTLYSQLLDASLFGAVLNEAIPEECARIDLSPPRLAGVRRGRYRSTSASAAQSAAR